MVKAFLLSILLSYPTIKADYKSVQICQQGISQVRIYSRDGLVKSLHIKDTVIIDLSKFEPQNFLVIVEHKQLISARTIRIE